MSLADLIFPRTCLTCKKKGQYVCRDCVSKVEKAKAVCPECGKLSIDGFTHVKCLKKLGLNGKLSIWNYDGVVRKAISALKYKYATEAGKELLGYFLKEVEKTVLFRNKDFVVVPIPLFWYRENSRGFNQSEFLGKGVAHSFGWKYVPDLLVRKKQSYPQVKLNKEQRIKNIRGAFSLNKEKLSHISNCLIFDDVYTTGSTLKEAAKMIKRGGVPVVWGLTVAN